MKTLWAIAILLFFMTVKGAVIFSATFEDAEKNVFNGQVQITEDTAFESKKSLKLIDESNKEGSEGISSFFSISPNHSYTLTSNCKTNGKVTTQSFMSLVFYNQQGTIVGSFGSNRTNSENWTPLEIFVSAKDVPENSVKARIYLSPACGEAKETGTAYFDNIIFSSEFEQSNQKGIVFAENFESFKKGRFFGQIEIDKQEGYQSKNSLKVNDDSQMDGNQALSEEIYLEQDKKYHLTAYGRTNNNVSSFTAVALAFYDQNGKMINVIVSNRTKSAEWIRFDIIVNNDQIPKNMKFARIIFQAAWGAGAETGIAWLDEIVLKEVDDDFFIPDPFDSEEDLTKKMFFIDSSRVDMKKMELPLELTDHNGLTSWQAHSTDSKPSLELSSGRVNAPSRLIFMPEAVVPEFIEVSSYNDDLQQFEQAQKLVPEKIENSKFYQIDLSLLPLTRKVMISFPDVRASATAEMRFFAKKRNIENYSGYWIWHTLEVEPFIDRAFRKKFTVDGEVKACYVQGKGDDVLTWYINGQKITGNQIAPMLKQGENIFVAVVGNHRYEGGFLAEIDIIYNDGRNQKIVTDKSWKNAYAPKDFAFLELDYNDAQWVESLEVVHPPYGIWGEVPYKMYAGKHQLNLTNTPINKVISAGSIINLEFLLNTTKDLTEKYPVYLKVTKNGQLFLEQQLDDGSKLQQAKKNETVNISYQYHINDFWYSGEYDFTLYVPFCDVVDASGDIYNQKVMVENQRNPEIITSEIKPLNGMPAWFIAGKPTWNIFYTVPFAAGYNMQKTMIHAFQASNTEISRVFVEVDIFDDNHFDFTAIDRNVANILGDNPNVYIVLKFYPSRGIRNNFFAQKYPEELVVFDNGKIFPQPSLASKKWMEICERMIIAMIDHIKKGPYADKIVGYGPCAGEEGQWLHHWGNADPKEPGALSDYSIPMQQYFTSFLTKKYGTDQKLQEAWNDMSVTIASAKIPSREARVAPKNGMFRDFIKNRPAIDFGEALSDSISDAIEFFGKAIKDASDWKSPTIFFYGHIVDLGDGYIAEQGGYLKQRQVIKSKYVDFFCGPVEYRHWARDIGGVASFDFPTPSMLRLHNKMWIQEDDLRTHLYPKEYAYSIRRPEQSIEVLAREFAKALCGGALMYLHEFGTDHRNWFDDVQYLDALKKIQLIGKEAISSNSNLRPISEIAVIASERSFNYMRQEVRYVYTDQVATRGFFQRFNIGRIGAPFEEYLVDDFLNPEMPDYKFYIFLNAYVLSDSERLAIKAKLEKNKASALWFYAPGYFNEQNGSISNSSDYLGINLTSIKAIDKTRMSLIPGNALLPDYKEEFGMFDGETQNPIFAVRDKTAETIAMIKGTSEVGLAMKKINGVTNYYASYPILPAELLRKMAEKAGVHIYINTFDAFYGCKDYIAIHTNFTPGERIITLPDNREITQVFPSNKKEKGGHLIQFNSESPKTIIYKLK